MSLGRPQHGVVDNVLRRGAGRVTNINQTTRRELRKLVRQAVEEGMSPKEAGELVATHVTFSPYRAELIARTELMFAYNSAALHSYTGMGVQLVEASDGDMDEGCAARNGKTFSVLEAQSIEDHPNGTLDWLPVVGGL